MVLAAGAGRRLAPLTRERPKALCPVGDVALVDHAIARLARALGGPPRSTDVAVGPGDMAVGPGDVAVNVHDGRAQMEAHLSETPVHCSIEAPRALGTAGALGQLRSWIDGRPVLVTNADAWLPPEVDLAGFVAGWDGERPRVLAVDDHRRPDFGSARYCGVALLPWSVVACLEAEPTGLYEACWRQAWSAGSLDLVTHPGPFVDCGTPADYLAANLLASGGISVIGRGATVGVGARVVRSVLWRGARVADGEALVDGVRTGGRITVLVR